MRASLLPFGLAALAAPAVAAAGGTTTGAGCNCAPPPPACCAAAPTHQITVPGVYVVPPTVYIAPPRLSGGASGGGLGESGVASDVAISLEASASTSAQAGASSAAAAYSSPLAIANSQAANLLAASGGGAVYGEGGGGVSGGIPNLVVSAPAAATRQVCARSAAVEAAVAVQAVCLDDRDVPHPASQVAPGQDVPEGYAGELFRCIAGAHMQYVTAPFAGQARFDHGQTVVCAKGDALWRDAGGRLQCRPQTPARDCNERSLLRRYGAGIKVLRAAASQCVEWRTETTAAEPAVTGGAIQLDGGVGA